MNFDNLTARAVVFHAISIGYNPPARALRTVGELYYDMWEHAAYRAYFVGLCGGGIVGAREVYLWIGERSPVWGLRWYILLSAIINGEWPEWVARYHAVC